MVDQSVTVQITPTPILKENQHNYHKVIIAKAQKREADVRVPSPPPPTYPKKLPCAVMPNVHL